MEDLSSQPVNRHDLSLAFIPAMFVIGALVAALSSVAVSSAFGGAALLASGGVGYALFYNPPSSYS